MCTALVANEFCDTDEFSVPSSLPVVDVVVNPILAQSLRPHQIEGVRFLYEKTMGMLVTPEDENCGAILADEMGLGK